LKKWWAQLKQQQTTDSILNSHQ